MSFQNPRLAGLSIPKARKFKPSFLLLNAAEFVHKCFEDTLRSPFPMRYSTYVGGIHSQFSRDTCVEALMQTVALEKFCRV